MSDSFPQSGSFKRHSELSDTGRSETRLQIQELLMGKGHEPGTDPVCSLGG